MNSFVEFLLKFKLFYEPSQTSRQIIKEYCIDFRNKNSLQDPITVRTYKESDETDKAITRRYSSHYGECNNAAYLASELNYSVDGIKKRIKKIANKLYDNILQEYESVQKKKR